MMNTPRLIEELRRLAEASRAAQGPECHVLTLAASRLETHLKEAKATDRRIREQRDQITLLKGALARHRGLKPDPQVVG